MILCLIWTVDNVIWFMQKTKTKSSAELSKCIKMHREQGVVEEKREKGRGGGGGGRDAYTRARGREGWLERAEFCGL